VILWEKKYSLYLWVHVSSKPGINSSGRLVFRFHLRRELLFLTRFSPSVDMTCPALLVRNTTDNPEWRAFIYHDLVSWFPGSGYVVEKLFREHYAPIQLASTSGIFNNWNLIGKFFRH
jgi:alpha-N-arabinofuranosidase